MSVLEGSVQNWQQKQGDDGVDDSFEEKTWGRCEAGTEAVIEQDAKDGVTNGHPKGSKKKGSGGECDFAVAFDNKLFAVTL